MVVGAASATSAVGVGLDERDGSDPAALWFVLHTLSRQEQALVRDLAAMGTDCYLPMVRTVRYYGRRKQRVELPLFPGYVFMRGELEQAYEADRTRRVAQIIRVADQDRLVRELRQIESVLGAGGELKPRRDLQRGMWVEVTAGPFKGVIGLIDAHGRGDRLVLRVQTLGQASELEIDAGLLSPLENCAAGAAA
jgi:transcription antitermination factor NusG